MMKNRILVAALLCIVLIPNRMSACTNLIVGKKASADGSVFTSYADDSYGKYGTLCHYGAGVHKQGEMLKIYQWSGKHIYLGEIPEASETYNVVGNINEHQVVIGETTFTGRKELRDTTGVLDYGSLIYIALQRSKTARQAIEVMTSLVEKFGYYSTGESFSICDPNEAWIMEMIGKGPSRRGAVWVAVRIPDDCISAHANHARIHKFNRKDKKNCLWAKDVISFAREKGYFTGKDDDFSFSDAYDPLSFLTLRACDARVWSFYNRFTDQGEAMFAYIEGKSKEPLPLYVKPNRKLSLQDVITMMRDHFEGTPLDPTLDVGGGVYHSPYRMGLFFKVDSVDYFCERPISTQQSAWVYVAQLRNFLPNPVGGVLWFGMDDANTTVFTPVYCCVNQVPECYTRVEGADSLTFSFRSSFWVFNWVANMVYPWYNQRIADVRATQQQLEGGFFERQAAIETEAQRLYKRSAGEAVEYLTSYSIDAAQQALEVWLKLGQYLIVKYNDGAVHRMKPTETVGCKDNEPKDRLCKSLGLPEELKEQIARSTGDRYKKYKVGE